jgi:integrase
VGGRSKTISRGVRIRTYPSGLSRIEIQFQYRGVTCKEILSNLDAGKPSNRKYAIGLKAEIESAITRTTFRYTDYFPNSPRAQVFVQAVSTITLRQAQESLLQDLAAAGLEATTLAAYRRSAERINQHLGDERVASLTPENFRAMFRARTVSRKTWNNDLIPARRALNRAVNDNVIQFSPLDRVEISEMVPRHRKPQPDPFSMGEIRAILAAAGKYCERAHNLFQFALFSGLRPEELTALQWADVDLAKHQASITSATKLSLRSAERKGPKTSAGQRTIDLLPMALKALKRQQAHTRFAGEHVFLSWQGNHPISSYEQLSSRWKTVLEKAGVRYRPIKQCRHTYASHQLSSGINPLYVAKQMGHSGTALLDVYGAWVDDWKEEHQERKYGR